MVPIGTFETLETGWKWWVYHGLPRENGWTWVDFEVCIFTGDFFGLAFFYGFFWWIWTTPKLELDTGHFTETRDFTYAGDFFRSEMGRRIGSLWQRDYVVGHPPRIGSRNCKKPPRGGDPSVRLRAELLRPMLEHEDHSSGILGQGPKSWGKNHWISSLLNSWRADQTWGMIGLLPGKNAARHGEEWANKSQHVPSPNPKGWIFQKPIPISKWFLNHYKTYIYIYKNHYKTYIYI